MFKCNNNGQCCEDPVTQISLTLGDIKRITQHTNKSALQLYKEGMIGICPFGNAFKDNEFETDVGLNIPCKNRNHKSCAIYPARPINCRLFPFWILAEAPMNEIEEFVDNHQCGACCNIGENFEKDREIYKNYKNHLTSILDKEVPISERFYYKIKIKNKIITEHSKTRESDLKIIKKLTNDLNKQDFSKQFKEIDKEIEKHTFETNIKKLSEFI